MVRQGLVNDGLVQDQVGLAESGVEIPDRPFGSGLAHRHLSLSGSGEVGFGPLVGPKLRDIRTAGPEKVIPTDPGVGAVGPQAFQGVQNKGQWFEVDFDPIDRVGSRCLVYRSNREHRLSFVQGLIGEARLARSVDLRDLLRSQDAEDSRHGECLARVDAAHPRVRHRAQQELGEYHALGPKVFRVFRPSGDFRNQIRWGDVLSDSGHV